MRFQGYHMKYTHISLPGDNLTPTGVNIKNILNYVKFGINIFLTNKHKNMRLFSSKSEQF